MSLCPTGSHAPAWEPTGLLAPPADIEAEPRGQCIPTQEHGNEVDRSIDFALAEPVAHKNKCEQSNESMLTIQLFSRQESSSTAEAVFK